MRFETLTGSIDEIDIENSFDAAIIDSFINHQSVETLTEGLKGILGDIGWTSYYGYLCSRVDILVNLGFLLKDVPDSPLSTMSISPKIQTAFDQGLFKSGSELFNPTPEQRLLLKMWDITPTKVEN